jgi:hypothetical protein
MGPCLAPAGQSHPVFAGPAPPESRRLQASDRKRRADKVQRGLEPVEQQVGLFV